MRADIGKNIVEDFVWELQWGLSDSITCGRKRVAKVVDAGLGHFVLEPRSRSDVVEEFHVQRRSASQKEFRLSVNNLAGGGAALAPVEGRQRIPGCQSSGNINVQSEGRRVSSTKYFTYIQIDSNHG